ncbi:hypothetical protein [Pseudoxanthomonas mexicana]
MAARKTVLLLSISGLVIAAIILLTLSRLRGAGTPDHASGRRPSNTPAVMQEDEPHTAHHPSVATSAQDPTADFESAPDLKRFLDSILERAKYGDPEAQWAMFQTYEYCKGYARSPARFSIETAALATGVPQGQASRLKEARSRVSDRCRNIMSSDIPSETDLLSLLADAAGSGHLAAKASLLSLDVDHASPDEDVRQIILDVRQSRNPQAYLAISNAMGMGASGREDVFGDVSGTEYATYAWQLAACTRGLACGPTSAVMTSYCSNGGVCGQFTDLRDLILNGLVPSRDARRVEEMAARL